MRDNCLQFTSVMIPHLFLLPSLHLLITRPHITPVKSPKIRICYQQLARPLPVTQVSLFITVLHNSRPLAPVLIRFNRVYDLTPSLLRVVSIPVLSSMYVQVSEVVFSGFSNLNYLLAIRWPSVTYYEGQKLNDHPNNLAKSLLQSPNYSRRLTRYYPAELANRFNRYSATFPRTIPNHL